MNTPNVKKQKRQRRRARIRAKIVGTSDRPRLSVYKSNKALYAQLIDDEKGTTLIAGTTAKIDKGTPTEKSVALGAQLAKDAKAQGIEKVVFDRGGFIFAGQIKALAESAREAGLIF